MTNTKLEIKTVVKDGRLIRPGGPEFMEWKPIVEKAFAKIGWKLHHRGCDHYAIMDHKYRDTGWMFFCDRLEQEWRPVAKKDGRNLLSSSATAHFYLKDCKFEQFEEGDETLCLSARDGKAVFILFHSYREADDEEKND